MLSRALEIATDLANPITASINDAFDEYTPTQLMILGVAGYLFATNTYQTYRRWDTNKIMRALKEKGIQTLTQLPVIGPIVTDEINEEVFSISDDIKKDVDTKREGLNPITVMPKKGWTKDQIEDRLKPDIHDPSRNSGAEYTSSNPEKLQLLKDAWGKYAYTNPMHTQWRKVNLMEAEVISMTHELLRSPLNKQIARLETVKKELADIIEKAVSLNPVFLTERTDLLAKQSKLREDLKTIDKQQSQIVLKNLKDIKNRLKKINKLAIKADSSLRASFAKLSIERAELERQVRNPGIMTHGGSTSIFEACKAHVFLARERSIKKPVILLPETAHVSFDKAANILEADIIKIPVDLTTGQVDVTAMEAAIKIHGKDIAMMVGSAPSFLYGIMDPIEQLGKLAVKYNVPLHVDSCLGGFLTAFAKDAEVELPPCDFSVPGVSSISIDTHKYGQTPKGTSILVFHPDCKASTTHVHLDWPGGMYVTPGLDGSRSGGDIATAWATLVNNGTDYYAEEMKEIYQLRKNIEQSLREIDGLKIAFENSEKFKLNVIGIRAEEGIDLLYVEKRLKANGWGIQIMQTNNQDVDGLHFCLTAVHKNNSNFVREFHEALDDAFKYAKSKPLEELTGTIKIYGKMKQGGVPFFVQKQIGESYVSAHNTIRLR